MRVGSRKVPLAWSFIPLIATIFLYIFTLSPTVGFIDSGELTTVCHTLGVAHPTGYPLYTVIGRLFSLLPLNSVAWRINLYSATFGSLAVFILFWLLYLHTGATIPSLVGSLLFGFSSTHWSVASSGEVYALTLFLLSCLLLTLSRWRENEKYVFLFFFLLGLSFTNHLVIICAAIPGVVYLLFVQEKTPTRILMWIGLFLLGLSLYLYLPIRAAQEPLMNWGNPNTLEKLLWHISGKQYRVWMFSQPLGAVMERISSYGWLLLDQYPFYIIWLLVPGFVHLFRKNWKFGLLLAAIPIIDVGYAINYDIPDINPYFLPSFFVFALVLGFGVPFVAKYLRAATPVLLLLPLTVLWMNYKRADQSENYLAHDYAMNVFRSAERNGIIITNLWDIYSPTLYLQHIEEERQDLCIIDKELLRRSWYFDYLEAQYPWLLENSRAEVDSFLVLLHDFEHGRLKDVTEIQRRFIKMINSFIEKNRGERPVYLSFLNSSDRDAPFMVPNLPRLPVGLLYRLDDTERYYPAPWDEFVLRGVSDPSIHKDERANFIISHYRRMLLHRTLYLKHLNRPQEADSLLNSLPSLR